MKTIKQIQKNKRNDLQKQREKKLYNKVFEQLEKRENLKEDLEILLDFLIKNRGKWCSLLSLYELNLQNDEFSLFDELIKIGYEVEKLTKFKANNNGRIFLKAFYRLV